jgi:hypothetical protein
MLSWHDVYVHDKRIHVPGSELRAEKSFGCDHLPEVQPIYSIQGLDLLACTKCWELRLKLLHVDLPEFGSLAARINLVPFAICGAVHPRDLV